MWSWFIYVFFFLCELDVNDGNQDLGIDGRVIGYKMEVIQVIELFYERKLFINLEFLYWFMLVVSKF